MKSFVCVRVISWQKKLKNVPYLRKAGLLYLCAIPFINCRLTCILFSCFIQPVF